MTRSKIFRMLLIAFLAGIGWGSFFSISVPTTSVFIFFVFLVFVWGAFKKEIRLVAVAGMAIVFLAGVARFSAHEASLPDISPLYGKELKFIGIVWDEPEKTNLAQKVLFRVDAVEEKATKNFFVPVLLRQIPAYAVGDVLVLHGTIQEDGTLLFPRVEHREAGGERKIKRTLVAVKNAFGENIDAALPEPHASFMRGLLLGERQSLPVDFKEALRRTGTTHLVALSGYNITLIGRSLVGLLLVLAVPFRVSFWIATVAIALFVIMTGAAPSVVRAGIMGILFLVAEREGRAYHFANALLFAAALMVLHDPQLLRFDVAFQLSFLATFGIVFLAPNIERFLERFAYVRKIKEGFRATLKKIFVETLAAQIAVLPLLIYIFGTVSVISPVVNVLVLLAVPYAMGLGFFVGLLGFLSAPAAYMLGMAAWVLLEYKIRVIEFFASFPFASAEAGTWVLVPLLFAYIFFFFKLKKRRKRFTPPLESLVDKPADEQLGF